MVNADDSIFQNNPQEVCEHVSGAESHISVQVNTLFCAYKILQGGISIPCRSAVVYFTMNMFPIVLT